MKPTHNQNKKYLFPHPYLFPLILAFALAGNKRHHPGRGPYGPQARPASHERPLLAPLALELRLTPGFPLGV